MLENQKSPITGAFCRTTLSRFFHGASAGDLVRKTLDALTVDNGVGTRTVQTGIVAGDELLVVMINASLISTG